MNIVSNCCATGFLYKDILHAPFPNPFIWSAMTATDTLFLIKHFNDLNFNNIEISRSFLHKRPEISFKVRVDDAVDLHYTHYILKRHDTTQDAPYNVYSEDIEDYVKSKYLTRLQRMDTSCQPTFLILDNKLDMEWSPDDIQELLSIQTARICLFSDKLPTKKRV